MGPGPKSDQSEDYELHHQRPWTTKDSEALLTTHAHKAANKTQFDRWREAMESLVQTYGGSGASSLEKPKKVIAPKRFDFEEFLKWYSNLPLKRREEKINCGELGVMTLKEIYQRLNRLQDIIRPFLIETDSLLKITEKVSRIKEK